MKLFLGNPKNQMAITLSLILITGFVFYKDAKIPLLLLTTLTLGIVTEYICLKLRKIPFFFPSAAIVTCLIITLLTSLSLPLYDSLIAVVIAIVSKNFLRISGRHIFNPAALGIITTAFLLNHDVSWWGVSFQQLKIYDVKFISYFLILLSPGFVSLFRMRRFPIALYFLITYIVLNKIFNFSFLIFNLAFDPTVLFFVFVMLPEPMTSPNNHIRQILFGACIAVLSILVSSSILNSRFDPFLLSLLIGNLIFFKLK